MYSKYLFDSYFKGIDTHINLSIICNNPNSEAVMCLDGYKHSMVQIIALALASKTAVIIDNPPLVIDTHVFVALINELGGKARIINEKLILDMRNICVHTMNIENDFSIKAVPITKNISHMFQTKYFIFDYRDPIKLDPNELIDDKNPDVFGKSIYRNRVFEDMQYCQICEETKTSNLFCVHIVPANYCTDEEITDKNNGLIMCKKHFEDYIDRKFLFKENGFIKLLKPCNINDKTHLSVRVKNIKRRFFLKKYQDIIEEKDADRDQNLS